MNTIVVLMCTHNGSLFIDEQLSSISAQTVDQVDVVVSDDKSSDQTLDIARRWQQNWDRGRFDIIAGPGQGVAQNFRSLIVNHGGGHDYVAFADQDDAWDADKLEVATRWLETQGDRPALYCGRTRYINAEGEFLRLSPHFMRQPNILNALVQNIAGGNTMVLNRQAMKLLIAASRDNLFVAHDWWSYLIVTACGGSVFYDSVPHMDYRLHGANLVGSNDLWSQRLFRIYRLFKGTFRQWTQINLQGLGGMSDRLTVEALSGIDSLDRIRSHNILVRLRELLNLKLYRQTQLGQMGLLIAIIFRKI